MGCSACSQKALFLIGEPEWSIGIPYSVGDYVVMAGVLYKSLQSVNLAHSPQEYPDWWGATTILQELEDGAAGITAALPLSLSGTALSLAGLSSLGTAGQFPISTGAAWAYLGSSGSGLVVRVNGAALVSPTISNGVAEGSAFYVRSGSGIEISEGGGLQITNVDGGGLLEVTSALKVDNISGAHIGFFGHDPISRPSFPEWTFTAFPDPVSDTATFNVTMSELATWILQLQGSLNNDSGGLGLIDTV